MHTFRFWDSWSKPYKTLFYFLAALAGVCLITFWISFFVYPAPLLQWEHFQLIETEAVPIKTISIGLFDFAVTADNHLVFETLLGSTLNPSVIAYTIFLVLVVFVCLVLLSIITTLSRFWFLMGTGLFILLLASLRMESLQLFGLTNKIAPGVVIAFYVITAFYFQSFSKSASFATRLFVFVGLTAVLGGVIFFFSETTYPFLQLAASAISFALIVTLIFILLIAHEIIASMMWIVGQGFKNSKNLREFSIMAGIYMINLLITYLQKTGYLSWGVYTLNLFLLLSISAGLSVWGFRHREEQYKNIFAADPFGVYIILSLITLCFTSLSFFFLTGNDPVIELMGNMILYGHLGYGIIFILYIISNFGPMLVQNLPVHRVLYNPKTMPYFTFRIMGLIASYAFLAYDTNWNRLIDQAMAGYYNGRGDVYYVQGDDTSAIGYFKRAAFYRQTNHHAHYALATIHAAQVDPYNERLEYAKAIEYTPTPYAYLNLSDTYDRAKEYASSAYLLNLAHKKFPGDGPIANALGLTYARLNKPDSALYFFKRAVDNGLTDVGSTNLLAQSNRIRTGFPADSLFQLLGSTADGTKSNALALANTQQLKIKLDLGEALRDTILNAYTATLLANYLINQRAEVDTSTLAQTVQLANRPVNEFFAEPVLSASAQAYYEQGHVNRAFKIARQLAYQTGSGKYHYLLGLWSMEQANPLMASDYFEKAQDRQWPNAEFSKAIALASCDSIKKAIDAWQKIKDRGDSVHGAIAQRMLLVLSATPKTAALLSEVDRYRYLLFALPRFDDQAFENVVNTLQNDELKARALVDLSRKWFELDEPATAAALLVQTTGLKITDTNLLNDIRYLNLMLAAANQNWKDLKSAYGKLPFDGIHRIEKLYIEARLAEQENNVTLATQNYRLMMAANVQFDEGLAAAVRYLAKQKTATTELHTVLTDGLLIKPNSVKLLKVYAQESARLGLEDEAVHALDKLKQLISFERFKQFVEENPQIFVVQ